MVGILGKQMFLTEIVTTFNDKLEHRFKVCNINLCFRIFTTGCMFDKQQKCFQALFAALYLS